MLYPKVWSVGIGERREIIIKNLKLENEQFELQNLQFSSNRQMKGGDSLQMRENTVEQLQHTILNDLPAER